ncbi:tRNA (adenosine(37)-N6)-threonylcarbamoyltransferase complex dimerization subunit type 1 TsaB [Arenivirga flava]|uniref:tRNA (Adenosine(37)-N6)-threonylcarbamoyltransferase complex dimerization subunit type 1 TsaB n=1 Tax=Arenivirga flava TaxID=1930060 RepID=A0AA37UG39_9MICO|nr:tRNA (adenosine(37)-N6)-threonylcarbamoyltransferase complex dimerization subunit type 1 TsaB [Arenivirga flava]GMA28178.1 tRNA (adenosine(37)-N6)-threonylcarbamoyltransferase complex dimerization subunit type 1 TsaB [Arenivirga flava]
MLLALDTSAGSSAAIVDPGGAVRAERTLRDSRRHAEAIGDLLREVLTDAGLRPSHITGVAIGVGPGPFTGLRVGIAAGRVFALGAGARLLPVVSHDALALEWHERHDGPLTVTTDARRRERYRSEYAGLDADGLPIRSSGPVLVPLAELADDDARWDAEWVSAAFVGRWAARALAAGRDLPAADALYLRSPDVTVSAANSGARPVGR